MYYGLNLNISEEKYVNYVMNGTLKCQIKIIFLSGLFAITLLLRTDLKFYHIHKTKNRIFEICKTFVQ